MSISLKFPDGAERSYDDGVTPLAVAEGISKSLAKKVVAAKIDGAPWDLTRPLEGGGKFELVMRDSADGLEILRHDAAHVLAQAVQELFPGTQVTFGPNGRRFLLRLRPR
jgi:threonyl-tRNA synthetase